jgi:hypothetical protein
MKIVVLGDIHGRLCWKDIIEKENPDKVVFLGDYVTTHDGITVDQQLSNLENILKYKEDNFDKVILLRGNHDNQCLGYYWAKCSGYNIKLEEYMSKDPFKERFLELTQWIYIYDDFIFSHAGVSIIWLENEVERDYVNDSEEKSINLEVILNHINKMGPSESFGFIPDNYFDRSGTSSTQSLTWIRPNSLINYMIPGYNQVVGHTPVREISGINNSEGKTLWLCDNLVNKNYLVIEDHNVEPKFL